MDFTKIFQLKGLKPKNKDDMNFYECCDLTEKVYLLLLYTNFKHEFINYSDIYLGWVLTTKKFRICAVFQKQNMYVSIARSLSYSTQQRLYNVQFIFISMSKSIFTDSASLKFLISFCLDLPLEHCSGFNHAINFHIQLVNLP